MKDKQLREQVSKLQGRTEYISNELFGYKHDLLGFNRNYPGLSEKFEKLQNEFTLLLKHLNLEYYKIYTKETNGTVKQSVKEGFRKINK